MLRRVAPAAILSGTILFVLTAHLSAGTKTVEKPMFNGNRLGWCANWGADCGEPAAEAWCLAQGFASAASFTKAPRIGDKSPTRLIATGAICDEAECDGFKEITCVKLETVEPECRGGDEAASPEAAPAVDLVETAATTPTPETEPPPLPAPAAEMVAAKPSAPAPEPSPKTTAAASPPLLPEAVPARQTATETTPAVRVITPVNAPAQAAPTASPPRFCPSRPRRPWRERPKTPALRRPRRRCWPPRVRHRSAPSSSSSRRRPSTAAGSTGAAARKDRCGKATADEFCKLNGFVEALSFAPDPKIGAKEPTRQIASGLVCDHDGCDGFAEIACTKWSG